MVLGLIVYQRTEDSFKFLPLSDSRWTEPKVHDIVELPASGLLVSTDVTITAPESLSTSISPFANASSDWNVRVERVK
jgi:hypothetical protein